MLRKSLMAVLTWAMMLTAMAGGADAQTSAAEYCEASWYGPGLYGNPTASGTVFYGQAGYAAHQTLPFGTVVRVTNLYTGASADLIINDRGPYIANRCIDISEGSAWVVDYGVAPVSVEVVSYPY